MVETYPDGSLYVTCTVDRVGTIVTYRYGAAGSAGGDCFITTGDKDWRFSLTGGREYSLATIYGGAETLIPCH